MIDPDSSFRSDLTEWLAGDALGDLDAQELQALAESISDDDKQNAEELRAAVAALQLAFVSQGLMSMPPSLRDKIASDAPKYLSKSVSLNPVQPSVSQIPTSTISRREQLAWLVTAASVLLAAGLWATTMRSSPSIVVSMNSTQARTEFIAEAADHIEIAWTKGTTPFEKEVSGDVVWSNTLQKGFMRFVGMPINDRTSQQYQLWIIDPLRDDEPIDGGVFDVTSEGEVVVPIDAKLTVISPAAFAVTIEKPGGVVVSDQKRLPLLAKVSQSKG